MRVLIAHNRYQQAGGEDVVAQAEADMLRNHGHKVDLMYADNDKICDTAARLRMAAFSLYSPSSAASIERRIDRFRPDILHVHNYHAALSPSVFFAAARKGVPAVHTLHNYRLVCPAGNLFRAGRSCTDCIVVGTVLPGAIHGCYRHSRSGTAIVGATSGLHSVLGTWSSRVARYIALSEFSAGLLTRYRVPRDLVRIKPNFTDDKGAGAGGGGYALFVGRLAPEKGIQAMIDADATGRLRLPIVILGDGPMRDTLEAAMSRPGTMLRALGSKSKEEVRTYMERANVLLVPSTWHEPFGLTVIEGFSAGCPVIASRMGGLPEIIPDGIAGRLIDPTDPNIFAEAINSFAVETQEILSMRMEARVRFQALYSERVNYQQLMSIYSELLSPPSRSSLLKSSFSSASCQ